MKTKRSMGFPALLGLLAVFACGIESSRPEKAEVAGARANSIVATILSRIATAVLTKAITTAMERSGIFDAVFGASGPDPWTEQKLNEIMGRLEELQGQLAILDREIENLEKLVQTIPARQQIAAQQAHFETCYERLRELARAREDDPELIEAHNRALLGRAYQAAALPPPDGTVFSDDYCAILEPLTQVQKAILPDDPLADRPLLRLAELARLNGRSFEDVVRYFAWVVGTQRYAMAIVTQARHRLGEDRLLEDLAIEFQESLRRQEIELLHAAESYVAYQPPYDPSALVMADEVVSWMEGTTWSATATILSLPRPTHPLPIPLLAQGQHQAPLDDQLSAEGEAYYAGDRRHTLASPYPYLMPLGAGLGFEAGRSTGLTFTRFRTTALRPDEPSASLTVDGAVRTLGLQRRNAATLEDETAIGENRDRLLLAHSGGAATSVARFKLLPTETDPRLVVLAVDLPARGLVGVPIGAVDEAGTAFAARAGVAAAVLEMVPAGPAEPERFALKQGARWLGVVASPLEDGLEPFSRVALVDEPFPFELVRVGDGFEVSYLADDLRRYLYVNEQVVTASDWQVRSYQGTSIDLMAASSLFEEGSATSFCEQNPSRFTLPVRGGEQGVGIRVEARFQFPAVAACPGSYSVDIGACYMEQQGLGYWFWNRTGIGLLAFTLTDADANVSRDGIVGRGYSLVAGGQDRLVCDNPATSFPCKACPRLAQLRAWIP